MYTNPSNVIKTLAALLDQNAENLNNRVRVYQPTHNLCVFEGMRNTLPVDAYPSLEIEPTSGANEWMTTRAQRPRYEFQCTLTVINQEEKFGVEFIGSIATGIIEIMTSPENLQMRILHETKWDPNGGLSDSYMLDSLVDSVTYNAVHEGTVRTAEFNWWVSVHEPFPESKFSQGLSTTPTVIRPLVIAA